MISDETRRKMSEKKKASWASGAYDQRENGAKRPEVREQISKSVKKRWELGAYTERINGMLGRTGEAAPTWVPELHTPTHFAEAQYVEFLSLFQDVDTCSRCGRTKGDEISTINVHHIDEDHSNFLPSNLEPLCVPCHASFHYSSQKLPFITVGKSFTFAAAHRLPNYNGPCRFLHGHEWKLEIEVLKRIDTRTNMVMDFRDIKALVNRHVVNVLDHGYINRVISYPTAESMIVWIWERLMFGGLMKGISTIRLWETNTSCATITWKGMLSILESNIEDYMEKFKKEDQKDENQDS